MEIKPEVLLFVTAILLPVIVQVAKFYQAKAGKPLSRTAVTIIGFVIAVAVAAYAAWPAFQMSQDPMQLATNIVAWAGSVFGIATALYNLVIAKLFEALGFTKDEALRQSR